MRGVAKTRKRKNAFFDLAGVARIATRFYVGTGVIFTCRLLADACATEKACYDFGLVARWLLLP
jgi:hypothetical protein